MNAKLPLPLELAQTTRLAADMNTLMKEMLGANDTQYNPETQVREDQEGRAVLIYGGGTNSCSGSQCCQHGFINVDDVTIDDVLG
jgi:hypothetical protein